MRKKNQVGGAEITVISSKSESDDCITFIKNLSMQICVRNKTENS